MAITVKHTKVSAVADSADTSLVRPSDWNADHTLIGVGTAAALDAGVANGVATLDSGGKVPTSQIPQMGDLNYQGTWNASTNSPSLASSVGTKGYYYVVNVAGSTNLNGITDWQIGDWAVFNGSVWQKIDNTDAVVSVNGQTGVVVLNAANVGALSAITSSDGSISVSTVGSTVDLAVSAASPASTLLGQVRNETGATLTAGTVVYISGAAGNKALVSKAIATSDATSAQTYGVITADILNNQNGYATIAGSLGNLNTSAFVDGTQLYLSSTTAGEWTSTKQYAPAHLVYVGVVTRQHVNQGTIEVKIQNGYEMDELHNVSAQTPSNGNVLIWNNSTQLWVSAGITAGTGVSETNGAGSIAIANTGVTSFNAGTTGLTPSTDTNGAVTLAGTLGVANGGTGLTSIAANRIPYGNGTSALNTSTNLTFDGTTLTNTGNAVIADNSTNAALRITQLGSGNALLVEDSANPDATPFVVNANGKVGIGTSTPNTNFEVVDGNANVNARSNSTAGSAVIGALGSDYFTTPSYRATYIKQFSSAATGTTMGYTNASLGALIFQNTGPALIYTNGTTALTFGTNTTERMSISGVNGVTSIGAAAGSESLRVTPVASAVNYLQVTGAATGNAVAFSAQGSDTNINLTLTPKGTGVVYTSSNILQSTTTSDTFPGIQAGWKGTVRQVLGGMQNTSWRIRERDITDQSAWTTNIDANGAQDDATKSSWKTSQGAGLDTWFVARSPAGSSTFKTLLGMNYFGTTALGGGLGSESLRVEPVASAVNYVQVGGAITGSAPYVYVNGSDTNIDLTLTPKGTGNVKFGTLTANADAAITGYITIKDSAGNLRKLAVIA